MTTRLKVVLALLFFPIASYAGTKINPFTGKPDLTGSGGGGSTSGTINASAQNNVGYYSGSGSTTTISGDTDFTFNGTTVTVSTIVASGKLYVTPGEFPNPGLRFVGLSGTGIDADNSSLYIYHLGTIIGSFDPTDFRSNVPIRADNGSASAPSLSFGSDTNTGFYWPTTADTFKAAAGGSDALTITSYTITVPSYSRLVYTSATVNGVEMNFPGAECNDGEAWQWVAASNEWDCAPAGTGDMVLASTQIVSGAKTFSSYSVFSGSVSVSSPLGVGVTYGVTAGSVSVTDEAYGSSWNASTEVPTKNAVYDKIETISASSIGTVGITLDGGGSALTAGGTYYAFVPYDATITEWTLIADTTGSMVIDVKKCAGFNCNPTTSIAGTEKPTLSSVWANQDASLSTWTTSVAAGDKIAFVLDSNATCTKANLIIKVTK